MVSQLLAEAKKVAVLDLEFSNLAPLKERYGDALLLIQCDVGVAEPVLRAAEEAATAFGGIDCAVHNACKCLFTSFANTGEEQYQEVIKVNYFGAIHLAKAVIPYMEKRVRGKIIFTSSGVGVTGFMDISAYASSKGALESLAKCLNIEYRNKGITFHLMHPPLTRTDSARPLPVPEEFKADPRKVGVGLARNIDRKQFIICHSFSQSIQTKLAYLFPIGLGKFMSRMTANYNEK